MPTTTSTFKTRLAMPDRKALKRKKGQKPQTQAERRRRESERKRCENCGGMFDKKRKNQRFCTKNNGACRKEFFRYGAAFGPLKFGLHKAIDQKYEDLDRQFKIKLAEYTDRLWDFSVQLKKISVQVDKLEADLQALNVERSQPDARSQTR
jgi:hypothetical protein